MKDCLMRCQSTDSVQRQSIFPKTNSPFLARDRATHTRFSVFKKPMRFSALLRTRERRMISFSSPWKLSTTVTSRSGEISNRFCSLNEYLLVKFNAQNKRIQIQTKILFSSKTDLPTILLIFDPEYFVGIGCLQDNISANRNLNFKLQ